MVSELARQNPDYYNKKSKRYVSELCVIAVFYLIPVGQLVHQHRNVIMNIIQCVMIISIVYRPIR